MPVQCTSALPRLFRCDLLMASGMLAWFQEHPPVGPRAKGFHLQERGACWAPPPCCGSTTVSLGPARLAKSLTCLTGLPLLSAPGLPCVCGGRSSRACPVAPEARSQWVGGGYCFLPALLLGLPSAWWCILQMQRPQVGGRVGECPVGQMGISVRQEPAD